MSRFFTDSFDHIKENKRSSNFGAPETIQVKYSDSRTGAEYLLEERRPNGPQGDFRISKESSDMQWRSVMGLPNNTFERPTVDNPFEEERLKPEPVVSEQEIENLVRERESMDTKRAMLMNPTREPIEAEAEDRGSYTLDFQGRIRDKPKNVVGLFGTEASRPKQMPLGRIENKVVPATKQVKDSVKPTIRPELELTAKSTKIEELLSNTFRSLLGASQKQDEKSVDDRKLGPDQKNLTKLIVDSGLLLPWVPPDVNGSTDRPHKPDDIAHSVGLRAIQSLNKGPIAQDIQDLPKGEREELTKSIGRTILNALTLQPEQKGPQTQLADRPAIEELKKSIALSISPSILVGLVNGEMLSDRAKKDLLAVSRISAPANKSMAVPNRHTVIIKQNTEKVIERPLVGEFKKKKMFEFEDRDDRVERREESFQRTQIATESHANIRSERSNFSRRVEVSQEKNDTKNFIF